MMGKMTDVVRSNDIGLINCDNTMDTTATKRYQRVKSKTIYTPSNNNNQVLYYSSESSNDSPMPKRQKLLNYQSMIDSPQPNLPLEHQYEDQLQQQPLLIPPRQRQSANARERDRTHSVNSAFTTLRTLIPTEPADRKLSKIETLRLASSYISHLGTVLMAGSDQPCLRHHHQLTNDINPGSKPVCTFCLSSVKKTMPNSMVRTVPFT